MGFEMRVSPRSFRPRLLVAGAATLMALAWPASALAQSTRTWVSGVGDDANPCSRTSPCKTWAGAISKTVAGGEIDALDPGGFGALTITKAITIDGGGGQVASVLVAGTNGFVVAAGPTDRVIIRNLRFQGLGPGGNAGLNGIRVLSAGSVEIENVDISGFSQNGIDIAPTAADSVLIDNSRITENTNGVLNEANDPSGNAWTTITNSDISHNSGNGVQTGTGGNAIDATSLINNVIVDNGGSTGIGVYSDGPSAVSVVGRDVIADNGVGLETDPTHGGTIVSFGDNDVFENFVNVASGTTTVPQKPTSVTHAAIIKLARQRGRIWRRTHSKHHRSW
jgi:hypothetical protein